MSLTLQDAVQQGRAFALENAAAGVAPGTAIGTAAALTIYNPKASGVRCVFWRASLGYKSGSIGAGTMHYVLSDNPDLAAPTGTARTPTNLLAGGAAAKAQGFEAATLPATPKLLRPMFGTGRFSEIAALVVSLPDLLNGEVILAPGTALSLEGNMEAGTNPLLIFGFVWEEVPIL